MIIKELKQPYKELALKRLKEDNWVNEAITYPEDCDLFNAFDWAGSPEGHDFWDRVNDGHYPDIPEKSIVDPEFKTLLDDEGASEGIVSWNHPEDSVAFDTYYKGELLLEATLFPEETITDHMNEKLGRKIEDYRVVERRSTVKKVKRVSQVEYRTVIQD